MKRNIFTRKVKRLGREPEHSLMVTIPRKICNALKIEKGTKLYFKLEGNNFIVSKDCEPVDTKVEDGNDAMTETRNVGTTKKMGRLLLGGYRLLTSSTRRRHRSKLVESCRVGIHWI